MRDDLFSVSAHLSSHLRCLCLQLECLGVGVVGSLTFVEVPDEVIDGEGIQVLADEVEKEPVTNLLTIVEGGRIQDGFHIRALGGLPTL